MSRLRLRNVVPTISAMENPTPSTPRRVAVIGGGIAGLAAAHRLVELDPACELTLFEAEPRLGGVVSTVHEMVFRSSRAPTTSSPPYTGA